MNPKTAIDSTGADELNRLRNTIETIDSLSQSGFGEIEAIAKLALNALENPKTDEDPDTISGALMTIIGKAQDIRNCINAEAEGVGCNSTDDKASRRRWEAQRAYRNQWRSASAA